MPAVEGLGQRPADGPPGVVDQDVDAAEVFLDLGDECVDGVQIGQVAGVRLGGAAGGGDPVDQCVQQFPAAGGDHHGGAAAGELLGGHLADARRRPGQQDPLAVEVNLVAVGPVQHQLRGQRRSHARQHDLVGEPAQRILTHSSRV